jgi:hypothetical protein
MEYYENFELSPEEIAEAERMIREDRKNELKKFVHNTNLRHETYYLINKQFEKEIERHPPKNINERHFNNKPENYPKVLMINEPVDWEESQNNLTTRLKMISELDITLIKSEVQIQYHNIEENEEINMIYIPTDIYGAFRYIFNKERNISSTQTIKIQPGITIQIEKHSKTPMRNYVPNYNVLEDYVTYEIRHDYQDQSKMLPYLYVFPTQEEKTQKYIDYLHGYVS